MIRNGGPGSAPVKMYYFQAEIVTFRDGIRTLKAEQRGVYLSVLLEIYDSMGPVLNDPKRLSLATGLDARLIARVVPDLVAMGKLYEADGWLHNSRAEKEITDYVKNHCKLSEIAKEREAAKRERKSAEQSEIENLREQLAAAVREMRETSARSVGEVSETSQRQVGDVSTSLGDDLKNTNKINGGKAGDWQSDATTRAREELRIENLDSKSLLSEPDVRTKSRRTKKRATRHAYSERFEAFWNAYPDKTNNSKPAAAAEFEALSVEDQDAAMAALPGLRAYCQKKPEYSCVHAERFLRDRRFEAYEKSHNGAASPWWKNQAKVAEITRERWLDAIAKFANGIWPPDKLGPAPGNPRCVVPQDIIAELRLTEKYTPNGICKVQH